MIMLNAVNQVWHIIYRDSNKRCHFITESVIVLLLYLSLYDTFNVHSCNIGYFYVPNTSKF